MYVQVMDPRYGWTGEKILQVKEVTGKDQGLFKLKMSSGFVYKKIYLTVVGKTFLNIMLLFKTEIFQVVLSHKVLTKFKSKYTSSHFVLLVQISFL